MAHFSTQNIKVSEPYPHVLLIELARKPVNAFSNEFWEEYGALFRRLRGEAMDTRAAVLCSALPKLFTAGIDINQGLDQKAYTSEPARRARGLQKHILDFQRAITEPERCPFPIIVAAHGPVIGLGIDILSACDIRYASSDALFWIKEVDVGLAADIGTLAFLPKITGNQSLARELAYTARQFSAAEAEKVGFVSKVVDGGREGVIHAAMETAKLIASKSPIAVTGTKHLITHARDHTVAENLEYTAIWNSSALQSPDVEESITAGKEKRAGKFQSLKSKL